MNKRHAASKDEKTNDMASQPRAMSPPERDHAPSPQPHSALLGTGILIPSSEAWVALLAVPLLLWTLATMAGIAHFR